MGKLFSEHTGSIDLYIIAGQSNGAGYSFADPAVLESLWSDYAEGSPSVIYRGCAEYTNNVDTPQVSTGVNRVDAWTNAKLGQGKSGSHMGAEVGMAARLSSAYYKNGKVCGIIKYAHGGTSIFDNRLGENAANGNWMPPSYAAAKGLSYAESTAEVKNITGNLYRNLLAEVRGGVECLRKMGYDDIRVKGVFWMQGESDRDYTQEYKRALGYFIKDLRRDLGKIMGEDLSGLAFMIGEISRTSGSAKEGNVAKNEVFISAQREVAEGTDNAYVIASGQYEINRLVNGEDVNSQDAWHWTTEPMFRIGELVGQCILDNVLNKD